MIDALGKPEDSMHACLTKAEMVMAFTGDAEIIEVCYGFGIEPMTYTYVMTMNLLQEPNVALVLNV